MKKLLSILILILFTTTVKAQLELPYPVKVVNPRSLDYKYLYQGNRPYTDTAEVNATIPLGIRHKGLIVNVNNTLWWYKDSVLNNSLVQIQLGGGISKTYADWGLSNVNDSTLKVDSSVLLTKLKGLNLIDSFRTSINATTPIIYTPSTSNIYLPKGSADSSGYISSTDWAAFDDKLNKSDTASMLASYKVASILTSGTLDDARLSSNVPKMVSNVLPAVDGSLLTNLNPASIATVIQTITATATINNSTTTLLVNPATVVSSLSITLCAAPYQGQIIRIVFGGTITSGNKVVTTLSILPNSGQSIVRVFPSVEAFAGDFIAFQYINTNWYQIN